MAVIRLALEIDGDVYPELHAMLALIASGDAKAERVRQLAASGLVWENVRIYGAAAIGPNVTAPAAAATGRAVDLPEAPPRPRAAAKTNARGPTKGRRATDESAPSKARGDFVDLAIDALPPDEELPRVLEREAESVVRQLPVLLDVVIPPDTPAKPARQRKAAPAPVPDAVPAEESPPPPQVPVLEPVEAVADAVVDAAEGADHTQAALHMDSLAQKPATRSRLMRMKEKGLFKNG